ncbi:hypothetical protein AAFF_G00289390 [Aldrovandia affinis]|uniref:Uncharacterized protein n=1 Tax=Aldrovandia affinis TaxID=143900 RepID=A0AAD7W248_9TELE|nr:hypothetical protein AAFF_G00289390 [Aldrovandia affinis]
MKEETDQEGEGAEEGEKDPDPLETNAPYPGHRRWLVYPPEFDKMLEKAFKEDIIMKFITISRIRHVLGKDKELVNYCKKLCLTMDNVRTRLRCLIFKGRLVSLQ